MVKRDHDQALEFLSQYEGSPRHPHSLLAEYVTGIPLEDPSRLAEKMIADKRATREKYGLPDEKIMASDPKKYVELLRMIAEQNDLQIKPESEYLRDSSLPLTGGAVYHSTTHTIYVNDDRPINTFEHELVHGLQDRYGKGMPVEHHEYEAYICGVDTGKFIDPEWQEDALGVFWWCISVSAKAHYHDEGLIDPWSVENI